MNKIKMTTPLVEMDGDEMTRIIWQMIKDELICPFVELNTEYYDLGLPEREKTKDKVTFDSAYATQKYGVAVKCATITPNKQRVEEYNLSEMWKSPNGTIRAILDGTVFRAPIIIDSIKPVVRNWKKPITIARHAYGDVYKATEYRVPCKGTATLSFKGEDGTEFSKTIYDFECPGVLQDEYYKKYPYKVGDKVVYTKFGDNCDDFPEVIESMKWTGTTIEYTFNDCVTCLAKDLKMWNGEPDEVISGIYLNSCDYADEVELNLGDYEIEVRDGRTFAVKKKPKYPTTYEECWKVRFEVDGETTLKEFHNVSGYYSGSLSALQKLLCCRDAYWKIAGKQMGLDELWKPKFGKTILFDITFYFYQDNFVLHKGEYSSSDNCILVFPFEEMRDAFYENFKDLIEQCKELL